MNLHKHCYFIFFLLVFSVSFQLAAQDSKIVNDITQLNPIAVKSIIIPTSTEEIIQAVKRNDGPVSIGGGRYSKGGQT
jgi:hypothetical protein